jgi:hypothetical protein
MNTFLNLIPLGKGMKIRMNIGRKTSWDERDGMIMDSMGSGKFFGSGKNNLVAGEDRLEIGMHRRCFNNMNGVELGYNSKMPFFEELFHVMGTNDLKGFVVMPQNLYQCPSCWNFLVKSLKFMIMCPRVHNHSTPRTMSQPPMSIENIWDFR